jgi:hypothetical protein
LERFHKNSCGFRDCPPGHVDYTKRLAPSAKQATSPAKPARPGFKGKSFASGAPPFGHHPLPGTASQTTADLPAWLTLLLASACGLVAANLYYAQPLVGLISTALGMSPQAAGLIVTLTQIGYCAGLLLIVPLGDLVENRGLVLGILGVAVLALAGAATATQAWAFLTASLFIGIGSVAVQVLVGRLPRAVPFLWAAAMR